MAEKRDAELWAWVTRDAKPLRPPEKAARMADKAAGRDEAPKGPPPIAAPARRPPPVAPGPGLDRRTEQKLRRGQMAVDRRLDLHGMTQAEAHAALLDTLEAAASVGDRCLLLVTGRGQPGTHRGVLRRMVPEWLGARRDIVLEWAEAQPRHGGAGALYVLLRRRREP